MGPILMNCCRSEQMDTKEFGKMVKRIQTLEEGRVSAKESKNGKIEGDKKRIARKQCKGCKTNLKWNAQWHKPACGRKNNEGKRRIAK